MATRAIAQMAPITIPAIAPPPSPLLSLWDVDVGLEIGSVVPEEAEEEEAEEDEAEERVEESAWLDWEEDDKLCD